MLSDKDRELISIGASLTANCQPCVNFHLRAARISGATDAEISRAVNDALRVYQHATEESAQLAAQYWGKTVLDTSRQENLLMSELVSISAACGIGSVPDLDIHLTAAQKLGATKGQVLSAIKIARAVKATAERKAKEATERTMGTRTVEREDCCQTPDGWLAQAEQSAEEGRARIVDCGPQCVCHTDDKSKV